MIYHQESTCTTSHFVAATLVSFWLTLSQATAQSRETAFGQIGRLPVQGKYDRFAASWPPGQPTVLYFWEQRGNVLASAQLDSSGTLAAWQDHFVRSAVDDFAVVDFSFEHKTVGVAVDRVERRITFYDDLRADTLIASASVQLTSTPGKILFGDLNNDKRTDFLVYDRETPGAQPYFGLGNEKFRAGKPLAPDNAIGDLKLVHLNNDSLIDIVLYDWVRSEIHLLYGVGQGKFLDQSTIPVDGEVQELLVSALAPGGNLDIVLSCKRPAKIELLRGDGLGDFNLVYRIPLKDALVSCSVVDVNNDGFKDIAGLDGSSIVHAFLNAGDDTFDDRLEFFIGQGVGEFVMGKRGDTGMQSALAFGKGSGYLYSLAGGQEVVPLVDSLELCAGVRPRGVAVADVNGDGVNDIILANGGSNALFLYYNKPGMGIQGAISYSLPASPHDVGFHSLRDSTARFLISYPESRQVSMFSLDERDRTATNATIGTERPVEFLYWDKLQKPSVDFFCFSPPAASGGAALTLFQEIGSHQFVERSFRLGASSTLLGAGVGLLTRNSIPDIAYVYRNNAAGKYELAVSPGDSAYSYRQKSFVVELPQKNLSRSHVWVADLENNGRPEIVMLQSGSRSVLERMRQLKDSTYSRPDTIALDVEINDWSQLKFVDLDGDGAIDIVVNDENKGEIGWLRGTGHSFEQFRPLCSVSARSHFAVGDLNGDGIPDLVISASDAGFLRIYDGKTLLKRDDASGH